MKSAALVVLMAFASWSAQAAHDVPGWRAGAAISFSDFQWDKPDEAIEDNAVGVKIYTQYQFNKWFGVEGAYHTTGDFTDNCRNCTVGGGTVDGKLKLRFKGFSGNVIGYIPVGDEIQVYGKVGYYDFNDDLSVDNSALSSGSENGLVYGGGAMIQIAEHFGLRADFDMFNAKIGDLWSVNLGVEYFFGGTKTEAAPVAAAVPAPAAAPEPVVVVVPPPPPADSDGDGVIDDRDECPDTPPGAKVDARGCEEQIVLRGVNFDNNSDRLTPQSTLLLDAAAETLKKRSRYKVEIQGHTDSVGSDEHNMDLSQRRADRVMNYLIEQGVDASKLTATGYGETQPIASNDTADGRSQNRRVTLAFVEIR